MNYTSLTEMPIRPAGIDLFNGFEGLLQDLSDEDELSITGGRRSNSGRRRRRRRRRRNQRSRSRSNSRS